MVMEIPSNCTTITTITIILQSLQVMVTAHCSPGGWYRQHQLWWREGHSHCRSTAAAAIPHTPSPLPHAVVALPP